MAIHHLAVEQDTGTTVAIDRRGTSAKSWLVLALLTTMYACNLMDRQLLPMLAQSIKQEFHLSDSMLGLLSGILFSLFYMTVAIPVARLADRRRRVPIVAISCALWSVFTALSGLCATVWQLTLARIGVGVGESGGAAPSYSLISEFFPPARRSLAMSIFNLGFPIGIGIGIAVAGMVGGHYGWRAAFVVASVPGFVLALLLMLIPEPPRGRFDIGQSSAAETPAAPLLESLVAYLKTPVLLRTTLATGLASFAFLGLLVWVPTFLVRVRGMTLAEVGQHYSLTNGVAMAGGLLLGGLLSDRLGKRNSRAYALIPAVGSFVAAPALIIALLVKDWHLELFLLMPPIVFGFLYLAPATALIQNGSPAARRSVYSAIYLFMGNVFGQGGGPVYIGKISDILSARFGPEGLAYALMATAPVYLLAGLAYLWTARALPKRAPST